jgi:hypothetical protein
MWVQSKPLSRGLIKLYAERYDRLPTPAKLKELPTFAEILGTQKTLDQHSGHKTRRCWRDCITGFAHQATKHIIRDETDWEKKGWSWYCCQNNSFREKDRILILDFADQLAYVVEVTDRTDCRTADGRHFVAFRPLRGFRRRKMTPALWTELRNTRIVKSKKDAHTYRRLLGTALQSAIDIVFSKR